MMLTERLKAFFQRLTRRKKQEPTPGVSASELDNPYRRMYTSAPALEDLARRAREQQKNQNKS